jgi:hypothetical protein
MSGIDWYNQARRFCEQISSDTGIPFISVCAVMAALSPMSPWDRNKIDCVELCNNNEEHRFTTFGANVSKAKRLLSMTDYSAIVDTLNGLKTISFFDNIYSPDSESVTVDSHMLAIAHGKKFSKAERPNLSKMIYHTIEDGVRLIADQFKLRPYELQAILWVTWRETV